MHIYESCYTPRNPLKRESSYCHSAQLCSTRYPNRSVTSRLTAFHALTVSVSMVLTHRSNALT